MAEIKIKCKGRTHDKSFPYHARPCYNKSWKDGYCKIHHPEEKLRKQIARMDEKDKLRLKNALK